MSVFKSVTTKIRHTLFGSVYSPLWEALSKCDVPHGLLCIYGVALGWGSGVGGVLFSFMGAIPHPTHLNRLPVTPRGISLPHGQDSRPAWAF